MTQNYNPPTVKCYHCGEWTPIELEGMEANLEPLELEDDLDETPDIIGAAVAKAIKDLDFAGTESPATGSPLEQLIHWVEIGMHTKDYRDALEIAREILAEDRD